ncbi:MAG: serine hydrolase domain-containing protein [Longimicrobiales bacterium]
MSIHRSVGAVYLLALPALASAQAPANWDGFTRTFQAYVDADRNVGASVLLMRNGQILGQYNTGFSNQATQQRVSDATLFHWGSITKTLTAVAIMQLRDRGKLSLDDRVTRYVPELRRVHDPFGAIDSITIRMLLAHTAGFQGSTWPYDQGRPWEPFEPMEWDQLVAMMPYEQLAFRPGTRYSYSNPAFVYLARIIEQLSGDPWESYVQKNIFAPLRLDRSYFRTTPYYLADQRSHNYYVRKDSSNVERISDNGPDFNPGITVPNGGWNAPLADLARYVAFLTNAKPHGPAPLASYDVVLARKSLQELGQPVQPMGPPPADANLPQQWMGMSFFVLKKGERTLLGHTGSQAAFRAFFYFNPQTTTAIIAAFNTTRQPIASAEYRALMTAVYDLLW